MVGPYEPGWKANFYFRNISAWGHLSYSVKSFLQKVSENPPPSSTPLWSQVPEARTGENDVSPGPVSRFVHRTACHLSRTGTLPEFISPPELSPQRDDPSFSREPAGRSKRGLTSTELPWGCRTVPYQTDLLSVGFNHSPTCPVLQICKIAISLQSLWHDLRPPLGQAPLR